MDKIKELAEWVLTLKKLLKTGKITKRTFNIIENEPDTAKINGTIQKLRKDYNAFLKVYNGIKEYIKIEEELVFGRKLRYVQLPFNGIQNGRLPERNASYYKNGPN